MSNEELAENARKHARTMFKLGLKSGNKIYTQSATKFRKPNQVNTRIVNQHKVNKAIEANRTSARSIAEMVTLNAHGPGEDEVNEIILKLLLDEKPEGRAGNCLEYALVARQHILGADPNAKVTVVKLLDGDHVFLAVGLASPEKLSKDVRNWGQDVWICDPWANIACPCADFPRLWKEKLDRWMSRGKYLLFGNLRDKPTNEFWYQAIEDREKAVVPV